MKHKKLAAIMASILMLAGSSTAAVAGDWNTTVIEATCKPPLIRVTVPSTGAVYINPFELPVQIDSEYIQEQIISTLSAVYNESEVPMDVDVTISAAINSGSDMTLSSVSTKESTSTSKRAFIYFEIQAVSNPDSVKWAEEYDPEKNHIIVRTTARTKKKIIRLTEDGKEGCYGAFRLTGDCIVSPKKEWNNNDGLNVKVAFTFTPVVPDNI